MIQKPKRSYTKDTLKKVLYKDLKFYCSKPTDNDNDNMIAEEIVNLITKYIDICEKRGRF